MDFPNIGAVTEVPLSGNLDIPSSLALGSYYVWFLVDPENKAGEQSSTRSNNNIALPISVLPDTSAPVVNIAVPAGGANVTTISSSIDVAGTATDNVAVAEITWNNDRGGNGTAQGTANWSISGITLLPGNNVINVSARDAAGNQTTVTVTVSYNAPDFTPPAVTIAFPSIESTFGISDGQLNVSGIATDDRGVAVVTWTNNRGGNGSASGTAVWSVNGITLQAGLNVITVTATDAAGNAATDTVAVTYSQPPSQFWRLEHFGTADASGNAADLADPDEDGLVNMVEFFLNGNPNSSAGLSLPTVGIENGDLTLTYTRNKAATGRSCSPMPILRCIAARLKQPGPSAFLMRAWTSSCAIAARLPTISGGQSRTTSCFCIISPNSTRGLASLRVLKRYCAGRTPAGYPFRLQISFRSPKRMA